jgi:hypothetical protein
MLKVWPKSVACAEKIAFALKGSSSKITFGKVTFSDLAQIVQITPQELQKKFPGMSAAEILIFLDLISLGV